MKHVDEIQYNIAAAVHYFKKKNTKCLACKSYNLRLNDELFLIHSRETEHKNAPRVIPAVIVVCQDCYYIQMYNYKVMEQKVTIEQEVEKPTLIERFINWIEGNK